MRRPQANYTLLGLGKVVTKPSLFNQAKTPKHAIFNTWNFTASPTSSKQFLNKTNRYYLRIINRSSNVIYYAFGMPADILGGGIPLAPGQDFEYLSPSHDYIHVLATLADSDFQIIEGVTS